MGAVITSRVSVMCCWRYVLLTLACLMVSSCGSSNTYAPVSDVSAYEAVIRAGAARQYAANKKNTSQHQRVFYNNDPVKRWSWPVTGTLLTSYSEKNKGIDIVGNIKMPVRASASGRAVYAGGGLRGYGKLIIIKHNKRYLSVYAYNSRLLVHEGEWVKRGQKIAVMGCNGSGLAVLHFEIRRDGSPVNPLNLIS